MLVRVTYVREEGITRFDEAINRTTRDVKYEAWGEFLVAWRKDTIEIYRDHVSSHFFRHETKKWPNSIFSAEHSRERMDVGSQSFILRYPVAFFENKTVAVFIR